MPGKENQQQKDGVLKSVEEICEETWESVYKFIYYKVQNREEAEDITQETYVKSMANIRSGSIQPEKYGAYLKTVAFNLLRDLWRKNKRRGSKVDIEAVDPKAVSLGDHSESSTQRLLIENALLQLNKEQRTVIELRILKGYSVAETARMMNKTEGAIRVMQHRALLFLNTLLNTNQ